VRVAVGGFDFEHAVADFEDGHVERAAAEVEHRDLFVLLLIEAVGERGGGRLVDDAQHFETGDAAGVLRGLALGVVEISGDRDDGLRDLFAEVGFGVGLHLGQHDRGDLLGSELLHLVADLSLDVGVAVFTFDDLEGEILRLLANLGELAADQALCREDGVLRVGDGLTLGGLADHALARFGESDDGRSRARAFRVRDDHRLATFHDGHTGVRRTKIDAEDVTHNVGHTKQCLCLMPTSRASRYTGLF